MITSDQINELAAALSKSQAEMQGAAKDSDNPFFKSKYADLGSVWTAGKPITSNGLCVIQTASFDGEFVKVTTRLAHSSGQWIQDTLPMRPDKSTPQGIGSCISYARRYALAAILGVYQTDDDAESATRHDPRGDLVKNADPREVDHFVSAIADILNTDGGHDGEGHADAIFAVHQALAPQHELYAAVGDALSAQKIIAKKAWKDTVALGSKRFMERNLRKSQ